MKPISFHSKPILFYPLFLAAYPVLALYGNNIDQIEPYVIWRPLIISVLGAVIIWYLIYRIMRDLYSAALYTSALIASFFAYGHVFLYVNSIYAFESQTTWHFILLPLVIIALGVMFWWVWRKSPAIKWVSHLLNLISAFLLVYPLIQTASYLWSMTNPEAAPQSPLIHETTFSQGYAPDIYYFVLDAYGRDDVFLDSFDYDNASFTNELKKIGFYVAECSQSNYTITQLSLGSSLNFDYLDTLRAENNWGRLAALLEHSAVRETLEQAGYQIISFENGYTPSRWKTADHFFVAPTDFRANDFEWLLIQTTATRFYSDLFSTSRENHTDRISRTRTLFILNQFNETIPSIQSPKFVFTHLIIPHPPYVFAPDGKMQSPNLDEKSGYVGQVRYINGRMIKIVQDILKNSSQPPIIIIQGDHGPAGKLLKNPVDRVKILNAYYLPGGSNQLYPSITPVNSFRIVFNEFFGTNYKLLKDVSLRSVGYEDMFNLTEILNHCGQ